MKQVLKECILLKMVVQYMARANWDVEYGVGVKREVTGDIRLNNADFAEDFDIADTDSIEPGTVMVLGYESLSNVNFK